MTGSFLLPYAIDASNIIASLAPRALKDSVSNTVAEIRQAWDDQVRKSQKRDDKGNNDKRDKTAGPKSPPPKPVNQ
jgi:hypothetical protein